MSLIPAYMLAALYLLWFFYLAVMSLQRARDAGTLTRTAYYLGLPILYVGLTIDVLVNIFVMTIMMLELPQEWLVTSRLDRHFHDTDGWRRTVAIWFAVNLLDFADPSGKHIK